MTAKQSSTLAEIFVNNAQDAAALVEIVEASRGAVFEALQKAVQGARSIVVANGEWVRPEILSAAGGLPNVLANPSDEQLARADAGITEAFAGVASSGSVCGAVGAPLVAAAS